MEPIALVGLGVASVLALLLYRIRNRSNESAVVEEARARCAQRAEQKLWDDTKPDHDPWEGRLDLTSLELAELDEIDDRFDGRARLDVEEKRIVNAILEGVDVSVIDVIDRPDSVFSQFNKAEQVDPWSGIK